MSIDLNLIVSNKVDHHFTVHVTGIVNDRIVSLEITADDFDKIAVTAQS